jgi:hypothetical protein
MRFAIVSRPQAPGSVYYWENSMGSACSNFAIGSYGGDLLFSIDAQIRRDHPNGRCKHVASAHTIAGPGRAGLVHLAMVVNDGNGDHLYLSLSNPASELAWRAAPAWTAYPFEDGVPYARPTIAAVRIGDASDGTFIVVDMAGNPGAAAPLPSRYYIDTGRRGRPAWVAHDAPGNPQAKVYASCLGRSRGSWNVDGVYLAAKVGDTPQLLYSPLCNPFIPSLPTQSRRLALPGELAAETIAACRNADNTSDLFATAGGALYFFSAANQFDGAQAVQLLADPLFQDLRKLSASAADGRVTVRGWNGAGQLVSTSADQVYMAEPDRWSRPRIEDVHGIMDRCKHPTCPTTKPSAWPRCMRC